MHHNVEHSKVLYSAQRMYFWFLGGSQNFDYPYTELIVRFLLSIRGWFTVYYIHNFLTQFSLTFVVKRIKPTFKTFKIMQYNKSVKIIYTCMKFCDWWNRMKQAIWCNSYRQNITCVINGIHYTFLSIVNTQVKLNSTQLFRFYNLITPKSVWRNTTNKFSD